MIWSLRKLFVDVLKRIFIIKKESKKQAQGILDLLLCHVGASVHKWTHCVPTCLVYFLSGSLLIWQGLFSKVNPTKKIQLCQQFNLEWLIYSKHIVQLHCNHSSLDPFYSSMLQPCIWLSILDEPNPTHQAPCKHMFMVVHICHMHVCPCS